MNNRGGRRAGGRGAGGQRGGRGRGRGGYGDRNQDRFNEDRRDFGNGRDDRGAIGAPRNYILGYKKLKELMDQDTMEVLMYLNNTNNGFRNFLDNAETMDKLDQVQMILQLLLRCQEERTMQEALNSVINTFISSHFFNNFGSKFLMDLLRHNGLQKQEQLRKILKDALTLLERLMLRAPTKVYPIVIPITATLGHLIPALKTQTVIIDDEVVSQLTTLKEAADYHLRNANPKTDDDYATVFDKKPPPDDFRQLSTIPTKDDLHIKEEPFLRGNKATGAYDHVDHYLDVQYRLLREDFISPLREGIEEYLQPSRNRKRLSNVILYENVRFVKPECSSAGIVYVLQLDTSKLRIKSWQASKRLIYGSLVCLSKDNFETFIIATVHERKAEILEAKGQVTVQIPDVVDADKHCNFESTYIMLETTAYFESYRHVLQGLQEIDENMPFKEHLVFCSANVPPPTYLIRTDDVKMDFRSILPEDATDRMKAVFSSVIAKDSHAWPQASHLGLDLSQWRAMVNAITKRLSIIQGPPGTGKTYIGLKLAKLLLTNYKIWADDGQAMRPILVVCYTNHALDQFLEGILQFSESNEIVRVGGRSKSVELEACMLKTLRKNIDKRAEHVRGAFQALRDNTNQLREAEDVINLLAKKTESASNGILPINLLEEFMNYDHYQQLSYDQFSNQVYDRLKEWLGFSGSNLKRMIRLASQEELEEDEEDEPEIVQEAEALEQERALDIDDEWAEILSGHDRMEVVHEEDNDDPEWQKLSRSEKRALRRLLTARLNDNTIMEETDVNRVRNVWQLEEADRWRLYRYWANRYLANLNDKVTEQRTTYMDLVRQRNEINNEKDAIIMREAKVIGMTTTGCARYRQILDRIQPKIVIVEEAAEVLEAHIVTALPKSCEHLIMIGDHKQLRPNPAVYKLAVKYRLSVSLFERMVNNKLPHECLRIQHRMRPEISEPMRFIYPELEDAKSVKEYENVQGVSTNMFYIDHGYPETAESETRSHSNRHEAEFCVQLCRYLLQQGYEPSQVTILTPYYGQLLAFKEYIKQNHIHELKDVRITVVDNFQGEENDIIILSLVRSNSDGSIGFLSVENRVCVALSRAKKGLFIIGNIQHLRKTCEESSAKTDMWKKLNELMTTNGRIGESLELKCQIHYNDQGVKVSKASDFDQVSEGGCTRMCEFRLTCGHTCPRRCHIYDREHIDMTQRCRQPCSRQLCDNEAHKCRKRCNEDCGPCQYPTQKMLPRCGHFQTVKCGENLDVVSCQQPCPNIMACGHKCPAGCSRPCTEPCRELVKRVLKCGHSQDIPCSKPIDEAVCKVKCVRKLKCEHPCEGTCQQCYSGHLHRNCTSKCERTLVCGHLCKEPCTKDCPSCPEKCENRCMHSKCQRKCGEECIPCKEMCAWVCKHHRCTKLCYQQCDRPRCNQPCEKPVPPKKTRGKRSPESCGHSCIGLCGEPCPKYCRICDKSVVEEIFFGDEDEEGTRFVELSDCGHVFSAAGLDHWMDTRDVGADRMSISLKKCPKCNKEIRQHLRYGNVIKEDLGDIEKAKSIIRGRHEDNIPDIDYIRKSLLEAGPTINQTSRTGQMLHFLGVESDANADETMYPKMKELWNHLKLFISQENPAHQPRGLVLAQKIKAQFMTELVGVINQFKSTINNQGIQREEIPEYDEFFRDLEKAAAYLHADLKRTRTGKMNPRSSFSDQQIEDVEWFIERLKQFRKYLVLSTCIRRRGKTDLDEGNKRCLQTLTKMIPYRENAQAAVKAHLTEMQKLCNVSGLGITDEERVQIVKAVGLSKGHWYKCPNGHVYAIADCGGAVEESKCPECGAKIGGRNHSLDPSNQLAGEMDGARYSAWSEQANMANYDFPDD